MAVAAIASVCQILEKTLQHQHLILHNRHEIESLLQEVRFLQDSLDNYNEYYSSSTKSSETIESLEGQIISAAHKARDVIQSHIMEQFLHEISHLINSYQLLLNQVESEISFIDQEDRKVQKNSGVLDPLLEIRLFMQLVSKSGDKLRTLSVVGLAGIGKTTLAKEIYSMLVGHIGPNCCFQIGAWATVSQSYCARQIITDLLDSINIFTMEMHEENTELLGKYLYKSLKGQRYLIVLDDFWDTKVWDDLIQLLPDEHNGSRILLTTRLENVAAYTNSSSRPFGINFWEQMKHRRSILHEIAREVEFLLRKVSLIEDNLETYSHKGSQKAKFLDNQIINEAKKIKNLSDSYIIYYNLTFSPQCLIEVKGEIEYIKQLMMKIEEAKSSGQDLRPRVCSSNLVAPGVVGLHRDFMEIKNRLAGESIRLEVISLVGMGGIGKTTLVREVYEDKFVVESFLIRAWVTISQSYDLKQVLVGILESMGKLANNKSSSIGELEENLYKNLKGRRYMIVIDDVWDNEVWDYLRRLFPDDKNSSRILLTTRLANVVAYTNSSCIHHMHFLDDNASWNLFCNKVFGENCYCPPELEEIGKKIVQKCGGLPLAIIVVGGLLLRELRVQHNWRNIAENLSSRISSNNDLCSEIVSLSYSHLPRHLKECFIYTGIFPEDYGISVSTLTKLWIAEGFLEPSTSNSLEEIAYKYLLHLVDRSLILVDKHSSTGRIKTCKIHDILRDFCKRKAEEDMLCRISDGSLCFIMAGASLRLLSIHPNSTTILPYDERKLSSLVVSSLLNFDRDFEYLIFHLNHRLVSVLHLRTMCLSFQLKRSELLFHNLRYFACPHFVDANPKSSFPICSNLQTLILDSTQIEIPIWSMLQLRHVKAWSIYLPDPLEEEISGLILENLQTLSKVSNFRWSMEVLRRIPNLKKLGICYFGSMRLDWQHYCLNNLTYLHKLEALTCELLVPDPSFLHIITFPPSLKKLTLEGHNWQGCGLPWNDMVIIASLPYLEVLKLKHKSFQGQKWELTEEQFPKLKYLRLENLDIEHWRAERDHFPNLQCLIIRNCSLKEIPSCMGEIPTLQFLELLYGPDSLFASAKKIEEEQLDLGNDTFQVRILGRA